MMRVGLIHYKLSCISGVGLLDNTQHYGGMYTGQALSDVVADIISGTVEYSIDEAYQSIPVYNWLPIGTRRENLQMCIRDRPTTQSSKFAAYEDGYEDYQILMKLTYEVGV